MRKQRVSWSPSDNAYVGYVRFPDGSRRKAKAKDKDKAQEKLDALLATRDADLPAPERRQKAVTFDDIVEAWIGAGCPNAGIVSASGAVRRHKTTKDESTIDQALTMLRSNITRPDVIHPKAHRKYPTKARVKASIGSLWIDRTSTDTVEKVFEAMNEDGLSTSSIYRTWWHLNNALAWAVKRRRIKTNPAVEVMLPEAKKGRVVKSLTLDAARILFAALPNERNHLAPLWLTALMVGTRPGEILGVRWCWVDLETDTPTFAIEERAHEKKGVYVGQRDPKVGSFRTIELHPVNVAALVKHRENLIALGMFDPEGFVFPTRSAIPHSKGNARKYFKRFCREAGLGDEGWTTNSLRHSFASIGDELLDDRKQVGSVMGHTKESTTAGYVHSVHSKRPVIEHAVAVWNAFLDESKKAS